MSRSVALSFAGAGLIWPAFTHAATLSGADLSLLWGVPFVGLLLSYYANLAPGGAIVLVGSVCFIINFLWKLQHK